MSPRRLLPPPWVWTRGFLLSARLWPPHGLLLFFCCLHALLSLKQTPGSLPAACQGLSSSADAEKGVGRRSLPLPPPRPPVSPSDPHAAAPGAERLHMLRPHSAWFKHVQEDFLSVLTGQAGKGQARAGVTGPDGGLHLSSQSEQRGAHLWPLSPPRGAVPGGSCTALTVGRTEPLIVPHAFTSVYPALEEEEPGTCLLGPGGDGEG